jgi:NADH:ubiquinone oxidoreductase subunit F (NADH-binding)
VAVGEALRATIERAIADRSGRDRGVALQAIAVPDRFVAGEETALVQFINGGPCLPTFTPPRPFERGVGGEPTLVQNVETLAHLALIARFGPEWFRAIGTADEPGSALLTLSGAFRRPGVYEVPFGQPLTEILEAAGGAASELQAWLVGGLFGTWITGAEVSQATLSRAGLDPFGAAPGARAIIALPVAACGVAETARISRYLADESAGQCGPCVHGLDALAGELEQVAYRGRELDRALTKRRLASITGRGACRHPDGAVRLIASAMRVFAGEFDNHERLNRCTGDGRAIVPVPARRMQTVP